MLMPEHSLAHSGVHTLSWQMITVPNVRRIKPKLNSYTFHLYSSLMTGSVLGLKISLAFISYQVP